MHGHTWRVRVTVRIEASELEERGMGPDLRALETATRGSVEDLEHRYLNDLEPFHAHPPTAERLAFVIAERMRTRLADFAAAVRVDEIEVWELPEYRVSYRPA
jgi:6-pyruvoyltetrahydropterin/6-carboxytetrahydropterin synthase